MNSTTKISIIHPSRQRPQMALEAINNWLNKASKNKCSIEYRLSLDNNDPKVQEYNTLLKGRTDVIIDYHDNRSAIDAINNSAKLSDGEIIVVVSDDFDCFDGWDNFLVESLEGKKDYLVKTSDGYMDNNWLVTLPIMDRVYYNRFGYVYYTEYAHLWCDTEMTTVGNMLGKVIDLQHQYFIFQHKHYSINLSQRDSISEKNDGTWNQGKTLFHNRLDNDFGLNVNEIVHRYPKSKFL